MLAAAVKQDRGTAHHILRRLAGKRKQENVVRLDPELHKIRNAIHHRTRLACSGTCNDQVRTVRRRYRLVLCGVQLFLINDSETLRVNKMQVVRGKLLESEFLHSKTSCAIVEKILQKLPKVKLRCLSFQQ